MITFEVCIDFDAMNWDATPDFSESYDNITKDVDINGVVGLRWDRGEQREEGNSPAATLIVHLRRGLCQKYSPFTTDANLAGKIRPWLPIRVRAYHLDAYTTQFTGFIARISINPALSEQTVTFYCTDGTDLLARQLITQDPSNKEVCSDGEAMNKILDAAGWPLAKRSIDMDGGDDLLSYPACHDY